MASGNTIPNSQRTKDQDETRAFTIDWSRELASGDAIAAVAWTVPAGLTSAQTANTTTTATLWVAGGTAGSVYIIKCRITTTLSLSHPEEQAFELTVVDESAVALDHYCRLDDVQKLVPQVPFTDTSKPPAAVVIGFIESTAARMDAVLFNLGYAVPVTAGSKSLALLREACAWGAVGLAQQVRDTGVQTAVTEAGRPMKNIWMQMFDDWLKRLQAPADPFELPDATRTDSQVLKNTESLLRSFVQSIPTDDANYDPDNPAVSRYQVL